MPDRDNREEYDVNIDANNSIAININKPSVKIKSRQANEITNNTTSHIRNTNCLFFNNHHENAMHYQKVLPGNIVTLNSLIKTFIFLELV